MNKLTKEQAKALSANFNKMFNDKKEKSNGKNTNKKSNK